MKIVIHVKKKKKKKNSKKKTVSSAMLSILERVNALLP